jgi:hypothetical protein
MTDTLLPCPHCGSSAISTEMVDFTPGLKAMPMVQILCGGCPAGMTTSREHGVKSWNTRPPSPKLELPQEVRENGNDS